MKNMKKAIIFCLMAAMFMLFQPTTEVKADQTITIETKGTDIAKELNDALEEAYLYGSSDNIYTIKVPKGTYKLNDIIHVYGNVVLDLTGVTFECNMSSGNMLLLGDSKINTDKSLMEGYGTLHNITVKGGTFKGNTKNTSSLIRMAHSKNVTFENCVFTGGGCAHMVELAAIDGLTIKNCTFRDMPGNGTDEKQEALQLDVPCGEYIFGGTLLDGTPMKNVTITGCTFKNVPRGLGSHSMIVGSYHRNITITNNKFYDIPEECIVALCYSNCTITGNVIENCGAGILVQYFKPYVQSVYKSIYDGKVEVDYPVEYDAKTTISNNTITIVESDEADKSVAIKVYGFNLTEDTKAVGHETKDIIPKNNYYISGVTVSNNTITSKGHGIQFFDTKESVIKNNKITCNGSGEFDGIFLEFASTDNVVTGNTVTNAPRYGICLQGESTVNEITKNTISKSGSYGIYLYNNSKVNGNIEENTVKNCKTAAIFLNTKSSVKNIVNNEITSPKGNGIYVLDSSKVSGSIKDNTITSAGERGISVEKSSTVNSIENNKISKNGDHGIYLYNSATVTESISENTIENCGKTAIFVYKKSSVKDITSNTITSPKGNGIYILDSSKVTNAINKNTITSPKERGISAEKSSTVKTISGNSITSNGGHGIYLYDSAKVIGDISSNKIKNSTGTAIFLYKKSSAKNITSNTITSPKGKGIYLHESSKVTNAINKNKITSGKDRGISLENSSNVKTISNNTISKASKYALYLYNGAKVTGNITGNTISDCDMSALFLNKKCTVSSITNNTITNTNGKAIYINDNSTVKKEITGNVVNKATKEGINVCSSKNDLLISGNTVSGCSSWPVFIKAPTKYTTTISENKLTSKKTVTVIQVSGGDVVVKNNTLSKGKWALCMNPGTTGTIGNNTLKSNDLNVYMVRANQDKGTKATNDGKKVTLSSVKSSKTKQMDVKWKKVSGCTGYVIEYATDKDFSDAVSVTVNGAKQTSTTIKDLKKGQTYYVRVCTYKMVNGVEVYQQYSTVKTVKIK